MSDIPPPPPPPPGYSIPPPQLGPPRRPGQVTAAGVIMIVVGALGLLVAFALLNAASNVGRFLDRVINPDTARTLGSLQLVLAAGEIVAGILVLRLSSAGRVLGIVVASLNAAGQLFALSRNSSGALGLALNAYILFVLITQGHAFRRSASG